MPTDPDLRPEAVERVAREIEELCVYVRGSCPVRKDGVEGACQCHAAALLRALRARLTEARKIVEKHRRHVELSPGVGTEAQTYGLAVCDDILAEMEAPDDA